jgi:hexosaminidase
MMVALGFVKHDFPYLLQYVDMCYFYKISVLHLDMSNRDLFTIPSKKYPKLPSKDGHYTEEQIAQLVAYASDRGIEIMPEIDMPGHCRCLGEAYPELFGTDNLIHFHEQSISAVKDLFMELCDLFPNSKYIHLGGDEADIDQWLKCPVCREHIQKLGLDKPEKDHYTLREHCYAYFVNEIAKVVFERGRQPVVWEGFAKEGNDYVSKDILVMSWENYYQTTPDLLDAGFTIVNCSWAPLYVVTPYQKWTPEEVFNWNIYKWQPVHPDSPYLKDGLEIQPTDKVIGGQLLAWGGPNLPKYCESIEQGLIIERTLLIERLPYVAQNTWNIRKNITWEEISANVEVLTERLNKIIEV